MKKILISIFAIATIIIILIYVKYSNYKIQLLKIMQENKNYEIYLNKQVYGTEITTLINKAVDNNEKYKISKDKNGNYIENETNSIKIQVKTIDLEKNMLYNMESFYNNNMELFTSLYGSILFECKKITYNKAGKVKYMLFEQITT